MVKTRQQIQLNYQKTLQQAEELEGLADQVDSLADQEIDQSVKRISSAWKGEKGELYCRKGNRMNLIIKQHGKNLRDAAKVLRNAAVNTYRAEMLSVEIAEKRWHL